MLRHTVLSSGFHFDHQHMDKSAEQVNYTCRSSSLNFTVPLSFWELTLKLTPGRSLEEETACLLNATDIHVSWRRKTASTHCSKTKSSLLRTCRGVESKRTDNLGLNYQNKSKYYCSHFLDFMSNWSRSKIKSTKTNTQNLSKKKNKEIRINKCNLNVYFINW